MLFRSFFIERLCNGCGTSLVTHGGDDNLALVPPLSDAKNVPRRDLSGDLDALAVYLHFAPLDGGLGEGPRFEESRSPKPFIYPHFAACVFRISQCWEDPA